MIETPTFPEMKAPAAEPVETPSFQEEKVETPSFQQEPRLTPTFPQDTEPQDSVSPVKADAHPKTVKGLATNVAHRWEDFKETVGGLLGLHGWKAIGDAYHEAAKPVKVDRGEVIKNVGDELSKLPTAMGNSMVDSWSKWYQRQDPGKWVEDPAKPGHFIKEDGSLVKMALDKGYYEPFSAAADVFAAWDLLANVGKAAGKAGKLAQGDLGALLQPEGLKAWEASGEAAGAGGKFDSLEKAGTRMAELPAETLRKGWDALNKKVGRDLPAKRLYQHIYDEEMSGVKPQSNADQNQHMRSTLEASPEDRDFAHNANLQGLTHEEIQAGATPEAMKVANDYKNYVENVREKTLKEKGLPDFNDDVLQGRLAKQYAKARYGKTNLSSEELSAMKAEMDQLPYKPTYVPSEAELRSGMTLEEAYDLPDSQTGKVGFMEKYTKGRLSSDPLEYFPRVIKSFRKTEAHLNIGKRILEEPTLVRSVVSEDSYKSTQSELAKAEEQLDNLGPRSKKRAPLEQRIKELHAAVDEMSGHVMTDELRKQRMPETGVYGKYLNKKARAEGLYFEELSRRYGESKALQLLQDDASFQRRAAATSEIVANPTLKRLLQTEFFRVGGPIRWWLDKYDFVNNLMNRIQTQFNPRYYAGRAVGTALVNMLSGTGLKGIAKARELHEFLPPQVQHVALEGGTFRKLANAVEVRAGLEESAKAGIITARAAKRMGMAADLGFKTAAEIERALPGVLNSTNELREIQITRQQIHEAIMEKVGQVRGFDREIAALSKDPSPHQRSHIAELQAQKMEMVGDLETKALESGALGRRLPQVQQYADVLRKAVTDANAFMGSANALSPIERNLARRFMNFYTFNKTMTLLAFKLPFMNPTSAFLWSRLSQFLQDQVLDPEVGERLKGFTPMFLSQDPKTGEPVQVWMSAKGLSHAGGVGASEVGGIPVPNMLHPLHANRFVSVIFRMVGGKTQMDLKAVPYGDSQAYVNAHDGSVITFGPNGEVHKAIPQLPAVKGIAHMFPQVQYAEHLLLPGEQTTEGWLLSPDSIKRPDGTYRYPYELMRSLGEMIGPKVITSNRDQLVMEQRRRDALILREMVKAMKTAGPEQREMIRQAIIDRQHAMSR